MPEVAIKPLAKGIGSLVLRNLRSTHQETGTLSALRSVSLFARHYVSIRRYLGDCRIDTMAELGPGSSLGVGFSALLSGVERYVGLDLQVHRSSAHDARMLEEVRDVLLNRSRLTDLTEQGVLFFPRIDSDLFWREVDSAASIALASDRIDDLRAELAGGFGPRIRYVAPWSNSGALPAGSIDWLMSHSVMEHVDDLAETYRSIYRWLKPGGLATHLIDFQSHFLTKHWNGHWTVRPGTWAMVRGRRPYLINRAWREKHLSLMREIGFEILEEVTHARDDGLPRRTFLPPFSGMPPGDGEAAMTFVVARKTAA